MNRALIEHTSCTTCPHESTHTHSGEMACTADAGRRQTGVDIPAWCPHKKKTPREVRPVYVAKNKPTVVCLCGSTRFGQTFRAANLRETLAGKIVLSIGCDMRSDDAIFHGISEVAKAKIKADLDELHLRKIDLSDEVLILNVGGHIGESTRNELNYAMQKGKLVRFWTREVNHEAVVDTRQQG